MNVITVVKLVARQIKGFFEAINFGAPKNGFKICYLKLSPSLDPHKVVQSINEAPDRTNKFGKFRPQAFIPKYVPHVSFIYFLLIYINLQVRINKITKTTKFIILRNKKIVSLSSNTSNSILKFAY